MKRMLAFIPEHVATLLKRMLISVLLLYITRLNVMEPGKKEKRLFESIKYNPNNWSMPMKWDRKPKWDIIINNSNLYSIHIFIFLISIICCVYAFYWKQLFFAAVVGCLICCHNSRNKITFYPGNSFSKNYFAWHWRASIN